MGKNFEKRIYSEHGLFLRTVQMFFKDIGSFRPNFFNKGIIISINKNLPVEYVAFVSQFVIFILLFTKTPMLATFLSIYIYGHRAKL